MHKTTYFGACVRVDNYEWIDEIDNKLLPVNFEPDNNRFYLAPIQDDIKKFGIKDYEFDDEISIEISNPTIEQWLINFKNEFQNEIKLIMEKHQEVFVVITFATVFD